MEFARLDFTDDGTPRSTQFDDVYFSKGHGLAETVHVFVHGNNLPERFSQLPAEGHFTIAETGFGTGLNFIAAWQAFQQLAPINARLTFVSSEKYPLQQSALARVYQQWPALADYCDKILAQYPPAFNGYHLLEFGRIRLILMLGDATASFSQLAAEVDAWFLDGFAPNKNPDMWQPALFHQMQRLSHRSTTAATFTAARLVRDGLAGAGFTLQRIPGYGKKRHMVVAQFRGGCGPQLPSGWPNAAMPVPKAQPGRRIAVIGAGIAGVTSAVELHLRGYHVELFEQAERPASDGSGNRQGAIYAKLAAHNTPANRFYAQALVVAQQLLVQLPERVPHATCGLAQLAMNERDAEKLNAFRAQEHFPETLVTTLNAEALSQQLGIRVEQAGLWFANGGWVAPAALVEHLLSSHGLTYHCQQPIKQLSYHGKQWLLHGDDRQWRFDQVVIASAYRANQFAATAHLPLNPIAGQTTQVAATAAQNQLAAVLCSDRYVMPALDGQLTLGSTFRVKSTDVDLRTAEHEENIAALTARVPTLFTEPSKILGGHCGLRANSPDYLPLLGAIAEPLALARQFRRPLQRNRLNREMPANYLPGLWINAGHGSKGLTSAPLCAKLLASMISGEPLPVTADVLQALNPNRFVVRNLRREQRSK